MHVPAGAPDFAVCDECKAELLTEERTGDTDTPATRRLTAFEELCEHTRLTKEQLAAWDHDEAERRISAEAEAEHYEELLRNWRN